jgi:hypothetical protein
MWGLAPVRFRRAGAKLVLAVALAFRTATVAALTSQSLRRPYFCGGSW